QQSVEHELSNSLSSIRKMADAAYRIFNGSVQRYTRHLANDLSGDSAEAKQFISELGATRSEFARLHAEWLPSEIKLKAYGVNPLLRKPLINVGPHVWAPYPELILYAAGRGLYFSASDALGTDFTTRFGPSFEKYVGTLLPRFAGTLLSEQQERELGF